MNKRCGVALALVFITATTASAEAEVWADWVNEHVFVGNTGEAKAAQEPRPAKSTLKLNRIRQRGLNVRTKTRRQKKTRRN